MPQFSPQSRGRKPAPAWHVGQRVWVVRHGFRKEPGIDRIVTRVGRVYGYCAPEGVGTQRELRFALDTGAAEFSTYVYPSREAYEAKLARDNAWAEFRREVEGVWRAPAHLSADDITRLTDAVRGGGR